MAPREDRDAPVVLSSIVMGFGTSVAMWATAFVCRLAGDLVPGSVLLGLLLLGLVGGGFASGRLVPGGWRIGFFAGIVASGLNLLILGSLLTGSSPNQIVPSALWWLPGSLAVGAALGAAGGWMGARGRPDPARPRRGEETGRLGVIASTATLVLLVIGGLVTSQEAGLAVVDWPNSYGYNMFLYPLSRMTGGVYYEHAHRLFGSLVGLTMVVLSVVLHLVEERRWLCRVGLAALGLVIVQGVLGGLRVTGYFTWTTSPDEVAPSTVLAVVHGVVGQVFFALVIALMVFTSRTWRRRREPRRASGARSDRLLGAVLIGLLVLQLVHGAMQRHFSIGLLVHITGAGIVVIFAVMAGLRAWGLYPDVAPLRRTGLLLLGLLGLQVALGLSALIAAGLTEDVSPRPIWDVILTTAHQAVGALVLAAAVALTVLTHRLLEPSP